MAGAALGWEIGAGTLGKSRQGFLLTRERWSKLGSWRGAGGVWPLRRGMFPCPETELALGVTVFLLISLQNPILYFWRKQ